MSDHRAFADVSAARGPATVAYALCALTAGTPTALPLPRALPTLAVPAAAMWPLALVLERCRASPWPAVTRTSPKRFELPDSARQQERGHTGGGHYATYHPASRFWPPHLVETGTVPAVAVLATAAASVVPRRRTPCPAPVRPSGRGRDARAPRRARPPREPPPDIPYVMSP